MKFAAKLCFMGTYQEHLTLNLLKAEGQGKRLSAKNIVHPIQISISEMLSFPPLFSFVGNDRDALTKCPLRFQLTYGYGHRLTWIFGKREAIGHLEMRHQARLPLYVEYSAKKTTLYAMN